MNKSIVRCRCGHQVLAKEVLRTDLYERRASEGSGREYVYVKFRCRRCKRMGEAFVAENRWDWSILEADHNELSESERDNFLDSTPISSEEILDFHRLLETSSLPIELKAVSCGDAKPDTQRQDVDTSIAAAKASPAATDAEALNIEALNIEALNASTSGEAEVSRLPPSTTASSATTPSASPNNRGSTRGASESASQGETLQQSETLRHPPDDPSVR